MICHLQLCYLCRKQTGERHIICVIIRYADCSVPPQREQQAWVPPLINCAHEVIAISQPTIMKHSINLSCFLFIVLCQLVQGLHEVQNLWSLYAWWSVIQSFPVLVFLCPLEDQEDFHDEGNNQFRYESEIYWKLHYKFKAHSTLRVCHQE